METLTKSSLETYFDKFRQNIIGINQNFQSPFGVKPIIYLDWTASGRLYRPIEDKLTNDFGPFVANTHTETNVTGTTMTLAYKQARQIIKKHVNASEDDVLILDGTGMTGVINKFQRILGLKVNENLKAYTNIPEEIRPIVFVSHMEHHSNQTSWYETIADVEVIPCDSDGLFCLDELKKLLVKYHERSFKICALTSGSNVTGIMTPYHEVAKMMHAHRGVCFVDFACSGPYIDINMHPEDTEAYLDAIYFSPHKFLGAPATSGVLIFNKNLYKNNVPDCPGGGTVKFTNPWDTRAYIDDIEEREDGGTPGFMQAIKIALSIKLKEEMGVKNILDREHELLNIIFEELSSIENLHILANKHKQRLGVISFYIADLHYNLGVKILNDRFGIQTRGGCSCAGTYGHYLLEINQHKSFEFLDTILKGNYFKRPGWIRMSIHPTTTNEEMYLACEAIKQLAENHQIWSEDYHYDPKTNNFYHKDHQDFEEQLIKTLF